MIYDYEVTTGTGESRSLADYKVRAISLEDSDAVFKSVWRRDFKIGIWNHEAPT